jgi:hypothetical protein
MAKMTFDLVSGVVWYDPDMASSHLSIAIEATRRELENLVEEIKSDPRLGSIRKLHGAINQLEDLAGQPRTSMAALLDFGITDEGGVPDAEQQLRVEPHEFYGLDALEAAKKYLKKVGPIRKSALFSEIVSAIRSGGGDPGPDDKLRLSLSRSTFEVAKIGDDRYGLLEFFPHVKRGSPGRKKKGEGDGPSAEPNIVSEPIETVKTIQTVEWDES